MPSFDVVSEVDMHEVSNGVDQANKEVTNRFDFKGSGARFEQSDAEVTLHAKEEFQLKQMIDILTLKLSKRGVDVKCLDVSEPELSGQNVKQKILLKQGVDSDLARKLVKLIKQQKTKVQAAIQGDQVRVTGKKRDDLQNIISMIKDEITEIPMQFTNFRD